MYRLILVVLVITSGKWVYAEDANTQSIIELLQQLVDEQETMKADIAQLQKAISSRPGTESTPGPLAINKSAEPVRVAEQMEPGLIVSVHPVMRGKAGAMIGRMVVGGFPMPMDLYKTEFPDLSDDVLVAYQGTGVYVSKRAGAYSFVMKIAQENQRFATTCQIKVLIDGQTVISADSVKLRGATSKLIPGTIELGEGSYDFKMHQQCNRPNTVSWDLQAIKPGDMKAQSLADRHIFHVR